MLRIGLTGGIGSGKSTVAAVFEVLGIPVYYADDAAKRLMNEAPSLKAAITKAFGEESYLDGKLNRTFLASVVFKDKNKSSLLNSIVHPATLADAASWMKAQKSPYCIKEAALIFESGSQAGLDLVIGVSAPLSLRVQRVMHRDHISREDVLARIDKQLDESMKMKLCDFVIRNDEQELLIPQVLALHGKFLKVES